MTKKYEIIIKYIQDLSVEIPTAETFIFSREHITKYVLGINISTKTLKNKMIEVVTKLTYKDPSENKRKSHFEISYATVIRILGEKIDKIEIEKILLCEVEKKIDFDQLYLKKSN